jgi:hypothetical protein
MPSTSNYAFLANILTQEQFNSLNSFLDNYFGVSDTYKYLFLLYFGFFSIVLMINIVAKLFKVYYNYRVRNLEKLINNQL